MNYLFRTLLFTLAMVNSGLMGVCPSGLTSIADFEVNFKETNKIQENVSTAVKSGLDYISIYLKVSEEDNKNIMTLQLLGQIEPVDSMGTPRRKFPENFVPELQGLLAVPLGDMGILAVIKEESLPSDLFIKTLAELVNQYNRTKKGNPVLVGTYSSQIALYLKKYFPELPFVAFSRSEAELFNHRTYEPKIYALSIELANQSLITQLNNESKGVWIFNINDAKEMEELVKIGAGGIITQDAPTLLKLKAKLANECRNLIVPSS